MFDVRLRQHCWQAAYAISIHPFIFYTHRFLSSKSRRSAGAYLSCRWVTQRTSAAHRRPTYNHSHLLSQLQRISIDLTHTFLDLWRKRENLKRSRASTGRTRTKNVKPPPSCREATHEPPSDLRLCSAVQLIQSGALSVWPTMAVIIYQFKQSVSLPLRM